MRSVSVASDGSALVAGSHNVGPNASLSPSCIFITHFSRVQGTVYVWTIQPGVSFTDLQPKTRFPAHSRYLIKVLMSPDTKFDSLSHVSRALIH